MLTDTERQHLERERKIAGLRIYIDDMEKLMMAERRNRLPLLVAILVMTLVAWMSAGDANAQQRTAYFTHETSSGGLTKQCHYEFLGERYSITVNSVKLCPLSISV